MPTVERTRRMAVDAFRRDFVRPGRPTIFTDLFAGQPIDTARTAERFRERFAAMPIWSFESYDDNQRRMLLSLLFPGGAAAEGPKPYEKLTTVGEYLDTITADPHHPYLCSESPRGLWTEAFASSFQLPAYCQTGEDPSDLGLELWMGPAGYITHMHFDADGRDNLLHQVFGRKRIILAPPAAGRRIGSVMNKGLASPEGLPDAERREWVDYIGGAEVLLEPGETLFIPALWWHYAEYLTSSFSIVMRHNRNGYLRAFYENAQPNFRTQMIMDRFRDESAMGAEHREVFDRFAAAFDAPHATAAAKHAAVQRLVDEVFQAWFGDAAKGSLLTPVMASGVQMLEAMLGQSYDFKSLRFKESEATREGRRESAAVPA